MSPVRSLERRQITVLFCDVVGWSSLAQQVDPEELADLIRAYRRRCATIVATARGLIAQYVGDGVVAYFGYPDAHEDAAERAVRAALDITERTTVRRRWSWYASESPRAASSSASWNRPKGAPRSPRSARRPIWRRVFSRSLKQAPSSCRSRHSVCVRGMFEYQNLGLHGSKGSPKGCRRGACSAKAAPRAVFTRYMHRT